MSRSTSLCLLVVAHALAAAANAGDKPPVKIGILGIDNYQAVEYVQMYNNPKADPELAGLRVTAAYPVTSDSYPESAELTERWKKQMLASHQNPKDPKDAVPPVEIVDSIEELLKRCDAVMIWSLDGTKHLAQATAILQAKKPLFIGRPLASNIDDAVAIFRVAAETKTPCWSCSQHRFSPGFIGMRNHPEVGKVLGCDVYGGYNLEKAPEADKFTLAIHSIETLYTIMGPGVEKVSCTSSPTAILMTAVWSDGRVGTFRGIREGGVKYSATVFGKDGVSTAGIYGHGIPVKGVVPTNDKYMGYGGLAIEMAKFFKGEKPPVAPEETLEMFSLLKAAETSRAKNGEYVPLEKLSVDAK